jgi:hypothetical protein
MCNYVNEMGPQTLHAPLESLTEVMFQYHEVFGPQCKWLINKSDPGCAIANFLRVFDFFDQEASNHCQFRFNMHASIVEVVDNASDEDLSALPDRILHVYAVLSSQPHRLSFFSGANREWKPYYQEPELSNAVPIFHPDVSITSVGWDGKSASITVQKHFPGFVRLERVYRVRAHVNCFSMAPSAGWNRLPPQPFLHLHCAYGAQYGSSSNSSETACDSGGIQGVPSRSTPCAKHPVPATHKRTLPIIQYDATHRWSQAVRSRRNESVRREITRDVSPASVSDGNVQSQMASTNWASLAPEMHEEYAKVFTFCQDANSPVSSPPLTRKFPLLARNLPEENIDATFPSLELCGGLEEPALTMARSQPFGVSTKRERSDWGVPTWRRRPPTSPHYAASNDAPTRLLSCKNRKIKNVVDPRREIRLETEMYPLDCLNSVGVGLLSSPNGEAFPCYVRTI